MIVRWTVFVFSLALLAVGTLALVNPGGLSSSAPPYAIFHLAAALIGLVSFAVYKGSFAPLFAFVFGWIDLYQGAASALAWFPKEQFQWTPVDDGLHWALGSVLVVLGGVGFFAQRSR